MDFIDYWQHVPDIELKEVVPKLFFIVTHSAMCERLFSIMSYMKKMAKPDETWNLVSLYKD